VPESSVDSLQSHFDIEDCYYCGTETPLRALGIPICMKCSNLSEEKRLSVRQDRLSENGDH
jgi:hypothetical protein